MNVGVVVLVEGRTRRRSVTTGATRHLGGLVGAVVGVIVCGYAIGFGAGNEWFGSEGFLLSGVDLTARASPDSATTGARVVLLVAVSVLFVSLVMSALAERTTFVTNAGFGLVSGGLFVPLAHRSIAAPGILGSITVDGATFVDSSAATVFSMAGWFGLIGAMVIGPRLGWIGSSGNVRVIPGRSPWVVSVGAMFFVAGAFGLAAYPEPLWGDEVANAALAVLLGSCAGATAASVLGWRQRGEVTVAALARGLVAGVVASSGALLDMSPLAAIVLGALGGAVAHVTVLAFARWKVDDPVAAVGAFGAAGVVGSLGARAIDIDQFLAQVVGQLIVAAWSIVAAGLVFGVLRIAQVLRVDPDVEMVGLDR